MAIDIKLKDRNVIKTFQIPETWKELTRQQFVAACQVITELKIGIAPNKENFCQLCNIEKYKNLISIEQIHALLDKMSFLKTKRPEFSKVFIDKISINGKNYLGWEQNFDNITWEEFIWADRFYSNKQIIEFCAVMFREIINPNDKFSDGKIKFSKYQIEERVKIFKSIPEKELIAIAINYYGNRTHCIEDIYKEIYPPIYESEEPNNQEDVKTEKTNPFSWISVHNNLIGENFFEEEKFLSSRLHAVLNQINHTIKTNKELEKQK